MIRIKHIHTKYSLQIFFMIFIVAISLTYASLTQFRKGSEGISKSAEEITQAALEQQMEKKAEVIIDSLVMNLIDLFYYLDIQLIDKQFEPIIAQDDVDYVYLFDADGAIVTDGSEENLLVGRVLTDTVSKKAVTAKSIYMQKEGDIIDVTLPIFFHNEKLGGVRIGFLLNAVRADILKQKQTISAAAEKTIKKTFAILVLISLLCVVLGIFSSLKLAQFLVRPILKFAEASRKIGSGDLTVKVKIKSGDELEELADSFNQMTADLFDRKQQLETLHDSAKELTGNLEINSLLNSTLAAVSKIIKVSKGSVMLIEGNALVISSLFGWKAGEVPRREPFSIGKGIAGIVAMEKESILANDVNSQPLFEKEEGRIWRGCKNLLCVPMLHKGGLKGVINIQDRLDGMPFTRADLEYGEIIASSAALSLANIELVQKQVEKTRMEEELKTAQTVQKTLFPAQDPQFREFELASFYKPATETGGDWFGYLQDRDSQRLAIFIGDVSGHGVPSALVTAAVSSFIKTLEILKDKFGTVDKESQRYDPLEPANMLKLLNKIVMDIGKHQLVMTFFVSVLDLKSNVMTFANAGHNPPYLYKNEITGEDITAGRKRNLSILNAFGPRLGDEDVVDFKEEQVKLKRGDVILWFTDGISECQDEEGEEFGEGRLRKILQDSSKLTAAQIKDKIISEINDFCGKTLAKDDIALIAAKVKQVYNG